MNSRPPSVITAVIDDDQSVLESLGCLLESADHVVHLFASATAFIDSGFLAQIGCLVTDIDMPVMDGFELLRIVHAERPDLPIILITGHPDMINRSSLLGEYRMFHKPFDSRELLEAVSEALRTRCLRMEQP